MLTDEHIAERLRLTSEEFRTLEETHRRLDAELLALLKRHILTPQEETRKKRLQKEKLDAKDRMAERIRDYRKTHSGTDAP